MKKLILIILLLLPLQTFALSVGIVSDIHAGKQKARKTDVSTVYPSRAVSYFEKAVKAMKGVDVIVVLGDNTQEGGAKYYKQLKKVENKYKIKVLWVRGNHDSNDFKYVSNKTNYYVDFNDIRIVVLDTNFANSSGNGRISPEGLRVFNEAIQTEKKIIVAMHHPPMNKATRKCDWNPEYDWVKDADFILSGHWHSEVNCGQVKVFPALTEKKRLTYRIINL